MWDTIQKVVLAVIGSLAAWQAARSAGRQAERNDALEAANEKHQEMQDVAARRPAGRDDVLEWMRKN